MKNELKNICRFPTILGSKITLSNVLNENNFEEENLFFSGNSLVLEKSKNISTFDVLLLLQIIETHQKNKENSLVSEKTNYQYSFNETDKNRFKQKIEDYCKNDGLEDFKLISKNENERKEFLSNLLQKFVDEEIKNKYKIYVNSKENYEIEIKTGDLLKSRNLRNTITNREIIEKSLKNLFNTTLTYYFFDKELEKDIKELKKNRKYEDWKYDVSTHFQKNKNKTEKFYRHIIESINISNDLNNLKIQINKGFLDFCDSSKIFNFNNLIKLKTTASKAFFINSCFSYKEKLTKSYMFEIMDLNSEREDKNLSRAKQAIQELILIDFLDDSSCYDNKTKMFNIKFTELELKKQGLIQQKRFIKRVRKGK